MSDQRREAVSLPEGIEARLEGWLARSWVLGVVAGAVTSVAVAAVTGIPAIVLIPAVGLLMIGSLSRVVHEARPVSVSLFGWGLTLRLLILLGLGLASHDYLAGNLLSPDGTGYLRGSRALADAGFAVGSPFSFFGTYDVGQYYVFAAILSVFGPAFAGLAVFNATIGALASPVAFAWARHATRYATILATIAALFPSLALLSTTNLLKDPLVILLSLVVALSVAMALTANGRSLWPWLITCWLALAALHTIRFYVATYLELGLVALIASRLLLHRTSQRPLIGLAATVLVAEVLAVAIGWPTSPVLVTSQVQHVVQTPAMQAPVPAEGGIERVGVFVARRAFGPYVWVPPARLDLDYLVASDFDLYPDTLIWYIALPFVVVGIVLALISLVRRRAGPNDLAYLAVFIAIYLAQYLAINLSYRQREDVVIFALAFVPAGAAWLFSRRFGRAVYAAYWVLLLLTAIAQIAARAHS